MYRGKVAWEQNADRDKKNGARKKYIKIGGREGQRERARER